MSSGWVCSASESVQVRRNEEQGDEQEMAAHQLLVVHWLLDS